METLVVRSSLRYRLVTLRIGSSEPKIRIKRGLADFHRELGNVNAVHRRQYRRTLRLASGNCSRQRRWGQPIDRCAWRKPARIDPDDSAVIRLRSDVIRLCLKKLRTSCSEARFGLRDVGARHFADIEAVTRLFQLLGKHFDVAAIEIKDRLVAYQIHVGGSGVEKNLLLGDPQRFACARHPAFRLACAIGGLKTIIKRLRHGRAELPGWQVLADAAVDDLIRKYLLVDGFSDLIKIIKAASCSDT